MGQEWVAVMDEITRPAHREAHGQQQEFGSPFMVGGEELAYPGDPSGSLENIMS